MQRFLFASTCSNYGRSDTTQLATEEHELRPLSLYAETKVAVERLLLGLPDSPMPPTVLRFATLYGVSPRMRFDLTVNQFVMEMLVHRKVTVYGERFWRPYVHVRDAARAVASVLAAPPAIVARQVFNVGHTDENYRKLDLVEMVRGRMPGREVSFVPVEDEMQSAPAIWTRDSGRRMAPGQALWATSAGFLFSATRTWPPVKVASSLPTGRISRDASAGSDRTA